MKRAVSSVVLVVAMGCSAPPPAEPGSPTPVPQEVVSRDTVPIETDPPKPNNAIDIRQHIERMNKREQELERERHRRWHGDTPEHFLVNIRPLVALVGKAKTVVLYEGLPHQYREKVVLEQELKNKKTVQLGGYPFYDTAIKPGEAEAKKLVALCTDQKTFSRWTGEKLCGGYHPDWCIEFHTAEGVCRVHVCYGCGEAHVDGPKNNVESDFNDDALEQIATILQTYRKNRPERVRRVLAPMPRPVLPDPTRP